MCAVEKQSLFIELAPQNSRLNSILHFLHGLKGMMSDSSQLVDIAIRLVNSVLNTGKNNGFPFFDILGF